MRTYSDRLEAIVTNFFRRPWALSDNRRKARPKNWFLLQRTEATAISADRICFGSRRLNATSSPGLIDASVLTFAPRSDRSYTTPGQIMGRRNHPFDFSTDSSQAKGAAIRTRG